MTEFIDKDGLNNFRESRNPWLSSSTYINLGSLGKIVSLAERTGQIRKETRETQSQRNEVRERATRLSPSLHLIAILDDLVNLEKSLTKVKVLIHHHNLEQETKDITDVSVLERKTKKMEELSLHLSVLVDKKDELITRLQQPFVGDYICIGAEYHRYVTDTIPTLGNMLSNLTNHLECITWSGKFTLEDGEMEKILGKVSSGLAQMQSFFQSLCLSRNLMAKLVDEDNQSATNMFRQYFSTWLNRPPASLRVLSQDVQYDDATITK